MERDKPNGGGCPKVRFFFERKIRFQKKKRGLERENQTCVRTKVSFESETKRICIYNTLCIWAHDLQQLLYINAAQCLSLSFSFSLLYDSQN